MKATPSARAKNKDAQFLKRILSYYKAHGRHDLPWRKSITPYKILISEIMLQQTQVSRVLPKFRDWMKKFPTLKSLQTGSFLEILYLWQGLGYQRRAKALFDIAMAGAHLPRTYEELLHIPGIGPYTASAIQAFAYDEFPTHLVETNIRTVLIEEFHQGETDIHDGVLYDDLARLTKYASVQKIGAREFYYALMDYGAYLKSQKISHNKKSVHYATQSPYKGSVRELRAKVLFAVTHKEKLPDDERTSDVVGKLIKEGYITKKGRGYAIV
jgi:A/G-specific adenine glycosylase